ncbi:hypothetical protein BRADI_5g23000v3 [Brachypodium distachyon]|uniref:DUF3615 domain-containing protein n=1 Tax=Brachypodium distachyon TaxID=15368 RepID=I1J289_BRADI|nr:hypothetical protein BRADI_5g23000v3 [Brachypodium distachyon]
MATFLGLRDPLSVDGDGRFGSVEQIIEATMRRPCPAALTKSPSNARAHLLVYIYQNARTVLDLAYKLKDVVHHESFREKKSIWYRHLNFTAKTKGPDGLDCCIDKLFFLELKSTKHDGINEEWTVSCFCMVEPSDNGSCSGCLDGMKHPNKADVYNGSHVRPDVLFGLPAQRSDSDEDDSSKERRIRYLFEDYEPFVVPAHATLKVKTEDDTGV